MPLTTAIRLLKSNDGDIYICEQEFHKEIIREICKAAECEEETAKEYYIASIYDLNKAVEKINQRAVTITTRVNKASKNEIGFVLWPETATREAYKSAKRNDIFIPTDDFDYILETFASAFPVYNPLTKEVETSFNVCGLNYFDNQTCTRVAERISRIECDDLPIKQFLQDVATWLNDTLKYAEYILVYGNL